VVSKDKEIHSAVCRRPRVEAVGIRLVYTHPPSPTSYLVAVTAFTEIVSPLAVPVTLASSQANLFSSADTA